MRPARAGNAMTESSSSPALEAVIVPRTRDLGDGFEVRRALPSIERRMVGAFVFLDQMGPTVFRAGTGLDVRPHPHIGLATVTYLFDGEILHRDSLGTVQPIRPGEVNWMTAGRGIAHSERTPPAARQSGANLFGLQIWVALPRDREEVEPSFAHHGAAALPVVEGEGKRLRVVLGAAYGARSPVKVFSEMFYIDAALEAGARLELPAEHEERAVYIVEGRLALGGEVFDAGRLLVLRPGEALVAAAETPSRLVFLGGAPMDGPRHLWWNFVSRSKERIEQAKHDWKEGRFTPVPDDPEFIPLPDEPKPPPVRYP
jgi:redox-sensitive bicupin YhaK (pirin superfamily)